MNNNTVIPDSLPVCQRRVEDERGAGVRDERVWDDVVAWDDVMTVYGVEVHGMMVCGMKRKDRLFRKWNFIERKCRSLTVIV